MTLIDLENEQYRRNILGILQQDPDYSLNDELLQDALTMLSTPISSDRLAAQLAWLEEQGLVTLEKLLGRVTVKITRRGEDVALLRARVPGVARPRPQ